MFVAGVCWRMSLASNILVSLFYKFYILECFWTLFSSKVTWVSSSSILKILASLNCFSSGNPILVNPGASPNLYLHRDLRNQHAMKMMVARMTNMKTIKTRKASLVINYYFSSLKLVECSKGLNTLLLNLFSPASFFEGPKGVYSPVDILVPMKSSSSKADTSPLGGIGDCSFAFSWLWRWIDLDSELNPSMLQGEKLGLSLSCFKNVLMWLSFVSDFEEKFGVKLFGLFED